jgi:hypothetical protein
MGEVYRATDSELGRAVAIKVIASEAGNDIGRQVRFEHEARAAAALNHPNILAVYDVGHHDGAPFIVSELLEGESLRARLEAGALPLRTAINFAIQLADGLAAAHEQGIIHRDLKPENIFVTRQDRIKILDFGLAKLASTEGETITAVSHTAPNTILGTVGYLSPEQASGLPADRRSDIFSFGVVLFEMITGRRAFRRHTAAQTLSSILEDDPTTDVRMGSATGIRVMNVARLCLQKSAEHRMQSARDIALMLGNELLETGERVPSTSVAVPLAAIVATVLLLAAAGAYYLTTTRTAPLPAAGRASRVSIALPRALAAAYGSPVALSNDGRQVAAIVAGKDDHHLVLRRLDRDDVIDLPGTGGAEFPFFSPDGLWLGFWSANKLWKVSTSGAPAIPIADSADGPFRGADWGDDVILFAPQALGPLSAIAVPSGALVTGTALDRTRGEYSHRWPQVLPGGKAWIYTALSGDSHGAAGKSSVMIHFPSSAETRELVPGALYGRYIGDGVMLYVRDAQMFAVRIDLKQFAPVGAPVTVDDPIVTRAASGATFLSVSANGSAAFVKGGPENARELVWVDRNGVAARVDAAPASYATPRLSPDTGRIAVVVAGILGLGDLWVMDVKTSVRSRVTADGRTSGNLVWSPQGDRILFTSQRDGVANMYMQVVNEARGATRLTPNADSQFAGSWLKDADTITYVQGAENGADIWQLPLNTGRAEPIIALPGTQFGGCVSPDGRWLAYISNETGHMEAFVTTVAQPGPRWQVSLNGGQELVWSADSHELYFRQGTRMFAAPVHANVNPPVGRAIALFDGPYLYEPNLPGLPNYDVTPEGRFLMIDPHQGPSDQVQVALNWREELQARLRQAK